MLTKRVEGHFDKEERTMKVITITLTILVLAGYVWGMALMAERRMTDDLHREQFNYTWKR